jgi:hypothetical protein
MLPPEGYCVMTGIPYAFNILTATSALKDRLDSLQRYTGRTGVPSSCSGQFFIGSVLLPQFFIMQQLLTFMC